MAAYSSYITILLLIFLHDGGLAFKSKDNIRGKWEKKRLSGKLLSDANKPISSRKSFKQPSYVVVTTWNFGNATLAAYESLSKRNKSAIDAVVDGCSYCEREQCDFTVGFGGSPDENGETTLDAMIYDGVTMNVGAVGGIRQIKNAIEVARAVLLHTQHTILVGNAATEFAKNMGFKEQSLSTNRSVTQWIDWKKANCQPNFWKDVNPDSKTSCGPYHPYYDCNEYNTCIAEKIIQYGSEQTTSKLYKRKSIILNKKAKSDGSKNSDKMKRTPYTSINEFHHDTIGQIVMDSTGAIVTGSSSNGAIHKIPGRMGDAAVPGAGGYADKRYGAAVATGDGDLMMRFSPAAAVVHKMKDSMSPEKATRQVVNLIKDKFPDFKGALLAMDSAGNFGASCYGLEEFPFTVASSDVENGRLRKFYVRCL